MRHLAIFIALSTLLTVAHAKAGKLKKTRNCNVPCGKVNRPLCASDGITYPNRCAFRNQKCEDSNRGKKLTLTHTGPCVQRKVKNRKACPNSSRCKMLNSTRNAVCGSDNTTYHTFCHFRIAKCEATKAGKSLTLLYKGVCGKPKIKKDLECPVLSQCPVNRHGPICGNNGVTYKNLCFFLVAKCEARRYWRRIKLRYRGACGAPVTPKPCPKSCPTIRKPVCGSNGVTYDNGCLLAKVKCLLPKGQKRQFRVQYRGTCGAPSTPKPCLTLRKCRRQRGGPVCGTDGRTYLSKCHLRVFKCQAKRRRRSPFSLKHMGQCIDNKH